MGLIATLKSQADKAISQLGYIKRDALVSQRTLFASEVRPGEEYDVYANYTNNDFYKLALTNPYVVRNIRLLEDMIAGGRVMIQERDSESEDGWKEIPDHEYAQVLDYNPNPFMSQSFIWKYQVRWLCLAGEAYWLDYENQMGGIAELYPLPANRVKPIPSPLVGIDYFAYTPIDGSYPSFLPIKRVCFHRFPNPFEYWRGLSPLSAFLMGLQITNEAQKTDLDDYKNRLSLQHLVSLRAGMPDREFSVAETDIKNAVAQGLRWKIIRAGDAKVEAISQPRNEFSGKVYEITEEQADYIYGIPNGYWRQESAYKQGDVYNQLINDTVWPLMNFLAEDHTVQYVRPYYGDQYRVMFEDPRPKNIELDLKQAESDREVQTYDEARELIGLPPHPEPSIGLAPAKVAGQIAIELVKMGMEIDGTADMQDEINAAVQEALASGQQPMGDEVPADDVPKETEPVVSTNGRN